MSDTADKMINFELVTPTALTTSEEVKMVVIPGIDGDFGVLAGHSPLLTTVRPGAIDMYIDGNIIRSFFVEGGFAEANTNGCTVLAESAISLDSILIDEAEARLKVARERLVSSNGSDEKKEVIAAEAMVQVLTRNVIKH